MGGCVGVLLGSSMSALVGRRNFHDWKRGVVPTDERSCSLSEDPSGVLTPVLQDERLVLLPRPPPGSMLVTRSSKDAHEKNRTRPNSHHCHPRGLSRLAMESSFHVPEPRPHWRPKSPRVFSSSSGATPSNPKFWVARVDLTSGSVVATCQYSRFRHPLSLPRKCVADVGITNNTTMQKRRRAFGAGMARSGLARRRRALSSCLRVGASREKHVDVTSSETQLAQVWQLDKVLLH